LVLKAWKTYSGEVYRLVELGLGGWEEARDEERGWRERWRDGGKRVETLERSGQWIGVV